MRSSSLTSRLIAPCGMSEIENLVCIRDGGIRAFLAKERAKWLSGRGVLCVHDRKHYTSPHS